MLLFSSWLAPYFGWNACALTQSARTVAVGPQEDGAACMTDAFASVDIWESIAARERAATRGRGLIRHLRKIRRMHMRSVLAWESAIERLGFASARLVSVVRDADAWHAPG